VQLENHKDSTESNNKDQLITVLPLTASDCDDWSWLFSDCISLVACDNCCVTDCRWRALAFRPVSSSSEAICNWIPHTHWMYGQQQQRQNNSTYTAGLLGNCVTAMFV